MKIHETVFAHQIAEPVMMFDNQGIIEEFEYIQETVGEYLSDGWIILGIKEAKPVITEDENGKNYVIPGLEIRFEQRV